MILNGLEHEELNRQLNDPETLAAYRAVGDGYRASLVPRILGGILLAVGNLFYGKQPSLLKFRALEIVARVPYHSWESAIYTLLTLFFTDPEKAMKLSQTAHFARLSQDNETMHVVVISEIARRRVRGGYLRFTLVPMIFAFIYFWIAYWLYFISRAQSLELNYLFENHAFEQYDEFMRTYESKLSHAAFGSAFLSWYGRDLRTEYEFFRSVRNDELIHRNSSLHQVRALVASER